MSSPFDPPTQPGALPVLTEELEHPAPAAEVPTIPDTAAPVRAPSTPSEPELPLDARAIEDEVMAELGQRIDLMFEYRLREALAPTLARAAELLIREAREEVALTLRDVVSRAVAQQLARRRIPR